MKSLGWSCGRGFAWFIVRAAALLNGALPGIYNAAWLLAMLRQAEELFGYYQPSWRMGK